MYTKLSAVALAAAVLLAHAVTAREVDGRCGTRFAGPASFYSNGESGRRTASGERFDDREFTAAHPCLPFGTRLRVIYGGRSIVVRVNDRGPFVPGRVLDLSRGAAEALGMIDAGVARVVVDAAE